MTAILSLLLETKDPNASHCRSCKPNSTYTKHLSFRAEFRQVCKIISRKIYSLQRKSNKDAIWGCLDIVYPPSGPTSTARNHRLSICVGRPWNTKLALLNVLGLAPCWLARVWHAASTFNTQQRQMIFIQVAPTRREALYQYTFCTNPAPGVGATLQWAYESTQIQSGCSTIMICFVVGWCAYLDNDVKCMDDSWNISQNCEQDVDQHILHIKQRWTPRTIRDIDYLTYLPYTFAVILGKNLIPAAMFVPSPTRSWSETERTKLHRST